MKNRKWIIKGITFIGLFSIFSTLTMTASWVSKYKYKESVIKEVKEVVEKNDTLDKPDAKADDEIFKEVTSQQMLDYLETKYEEEFDFIDYDSGTIYEREAMLVYPKAGSDLYDTFKIAKQTDGTYIEGYLPVYAKKKVIKDLTNDLNEKAYLKNKSMYLDIQIKGMTAKTKKEVDDNTIDHYGVKGDITLLLNSEEVDKENITKASRELREVLQENGIHANTMKVKTIRITNFNKLTIDTYDKYNKPRYIKDEVADV